MANAAHDSNALRNFRFDTKDVDWKDFITAGCYYKLLDVNVGARTADMIVKFDRLEERPDGVAFHWTLTGTNTGPGGTGKRVRISGYELWQLNNDGLIQTSKGHFDAAEYDRQLKHGA